jgi:hypothetical protein
LTIRARAIALVLAGAALPVALAACGSPAPSGAVSSVGSASPAPSTRPTSAGVSPAPSAGTGSSPAAAGSGAPIAADPTLLDGLPVAAAGLQLVYDADTTASLTSDPNLAHDAAAIATGLATPAGQASPAEFVIVNAVRLRDPSLDEEWFRAWRDSYDKAACEQAGGVTGHAETEIQKRTVFIGSCANGVYTYHTRLGNGGIVLSLTSIGPSRLGEKLLQQLAP